MALTDNIISYRKLDETTGNAADSVASNTLTASNVTRVSGKINNGASFAGTGYLYKGENLGVTGGTITLSCRVKMNSEISSGEQWFITQDNTSTQVRYGIAYEYNGGTRRICFYRTKNDVASQCSYYTITLGTSNWYHLVLTYDGTEIKGYIDTTATTPTAASGNGSGGGRNEFLLGAYYTGGFGQANAIVDEAGIWSRALSSTEVTSLNNSGNGIQYPSTGGTFIPKIIQF